MSLNRSKAPKGGSNFTIMDADTYPARVVSIVDLGLHETFYEGESKGIKQQINITFEFPGEFVEIEKDGEVKQLPRWMSMNEVNVSEHEKSKFVSIMKALDPKDEAGDDIGALLNATCAVSITHSTPTKGKHKGKTFANVGSVAGLMKGIEVGELVNEAYIFDFDAPTKEAYNRLPAFVIEKIQSAENYDELEAKISEVLSEEDDIDEEEVVEEKPKAKKKKATKKVKKTEPEEVEDIDEYEGDDGIPY